MELFLRQLKNVIHISNMPVKRICARVKDSKEVEFHLKEKETVVKKYQQLQRF